MTTNEKKLLLQLAKQAIESRLNNSKLSLSVGSLPESLKIKQACFVTLTSKGNLRGCIGHILPVQPLWQDIIENAQAAAFSDPRFFPLSEEEFKQTNIEISLLSLPLRLDYKTTDELLDYLSKQKPGVILKKGHYQATFLPQVWDELTEPKEFLTHLSLKAGLSPKEWAQDIEIETYQVEKITQ